jgi:hypothetical protein
MPPYAVVALPPKLFVASLMFGPPNSHTLLLGAGDGCASREERVELHPRRWVGAARTDEDVALAVWPGTPLERLQALASRLHRSIRRWQKLLPAYSC